MPAFYSRDYHQVAKTQDAYSACLTLFLGAATLLVSINASKCGYPAAAGNENDNSMQKEYNKIPMLQLTSDSLEVKLQAPSHFKIMNQFQF